MFRFSFDESANIFSTGFSFGLKKIGLSKHFSSSLVFSSSVTKSRENFDGSLSLSHLIAHNAI